jgi:Acyl-CoA dehydrogenase, N-terminal domain
VLCADSSGTLSSLPYCDGKRLPCLIQKLIDGDPRLGPEGVGHGSADGNPAASDVEFGLTEEQELLREQVRRFAEEVGRAPREIDQTGEFPRSFFGQAGELGMFIPEEYGGAGIDALSYCLVIEDVSRVCAPPPGAMTTTTS